MRVGHLSFDVLYGMTLTPPSFRYLPQVSPPPPSPGGPPGCPHLGCPPARPRPAAGAAAAGAREGGRPAPPHPPRRGAARPPGSPGSLGTAQWAAWAGPGRRGRRQQCETFPGRRGAGSAGRPATFSAGGAGARRRSGGCSPAPGPASAVAGGLSTPRDFSPRNFYGDFGCCCSAPVSIRAREDGMTGCREVALPGGSPRAGGSRRRSPGGRGKETKKRAMGGEPTTCRFPTWSPTAVLWTLTVA